VIRNKGSKKLLKVRSRQNRRHWNQKAHANLFLCILINSDNQTWRNILGQKWDF